MRTRKLPRHAPAALKSSLPEAGWSEAPNNAVRDSLAATVAAGRLIL